MSGDMTASELLSRGAKICNICTSYALKNFGGGFFPPWVHCHHEEEKCIYSRSVSQIGIEPKCPGNGKKEEIKCSLCIITGVSYLKPRADFFSPFIIAQFIGAAPRYCGKREACRLNVPSFGIDHTDSGSILKATTTAISGLSNANSLMNSGFFNFSGCIIFSPFS